MGYFDDFDTGYGDQLKEGDDYYMSKAGYRIMTEKFLRNRGYCCANGCKHCPYHPRAVKGNRTLRNP